MKVWIAVTVIIGILLSAACVPTQQTTGDFLSTNDSLIDSTEEQNQIRRATATPTSIAEDEALVADAQSYANHFGVSLEEAIRRLQLQESFGGLGTTLTEQEREAFAGLWVENVPEYRMVVAFTENGEETIRPYVEGQPYEEFVEVRTAAHPLHELRATQTELSATIFQLGIDVLSSVDQSANRVILEVIDADQLQTTLQEAGIQLPDYVEVVEVESLPVPEGG